MQCFRMSDLPGGIPVSTRKLSISHSKIRHFQISDVIGMSILQELSLFSSGIESIENITLKGLTHLKSLEIRKNKLTNVPRPLPPNLEILKLGDNSISVIYHHDFEDLKKLRVLEMQNNLLRLLSFSVFSDLIGIESLILEGNQLESVNDQVMLPQLRYLNMDNNKLQYFPDNFFLYFSSLQYLRLAGNQLLKIPAHLPEVLQHLLLERNHIKNVKIRDIKHLENLSELNLSGNQITSSDSVQVLSNLSSFDISKNQILLLPHKLPTKLQRFDCSNNQISRLTVHSFKGLQSLKHLFLDNNVVSRVDDNSFQWCVHLSNLAMEQNLITSVPRGLPVTLTRLDLKGNKIESIGESDVKGLRKLQVLNLRNNKISTLDPQVLECLPRLRHLYLDGNPWNCTCKLLMVKRHLIDKGTDIRGGQCAEPSNYRGESWISSEATLRHCENTLNKNKENRKKLKFDEFSNVNMHIGGKPWQH
uniref:Uncharacterized protein n=1 Tax=Leptobrachium leishanense TaxID=445787 RepID=A0A8C5QHS5_9ANUR